jgi:thiamine kinase-like enzyme
LDETGAQIIRKLSSEYGIEAADLSQQQGGQMGPAYAAVAADGSRWFIKLSLPFSDQCFEPLDRTAALVASYELERVVRSGRAVGPHLRRDGMPITFIDGGVMVVFPFIDAEPLGPPERWTRTTVAEVTRLIAEVHAATHIVRAHVAEDNFRLLGRQALTDLLQLLQSQRTGPRDDARRLIWPHRAELLRIEHEYVDLQARLREISHDLVLCHLDLNGDNLRRDNQGQLILIDWEHLALAPLESDLTILLGEHAAVAWSEYTQIRGQRECMSDVVAFQYYTWFVGYLRFFLCRLLQQDRTPEQQKQDLWNTRMTIDAGVGGRFDRELSANVAAARALLSGSSGPTRH